MKGQRRSGTGRRDRRSVLVRIAHCHKKVLKLPRFYKLSVNIPPHQVLHPTAKIEEAL